jgi:hypothetical protein
MQNAAKIFFLTAGIVAVGGCHKAQPQANATANEDLSLGGNATAGQVPPNAQIEALPADKSSTTSSSDRNSGADTPDVNEGGNRG